MKAEQIAKEREKGDSVETNIVVILAQYEVEDHPFFWPAILPTRSTGSRMR